VGGTEPDPRGTREVAYDVSDLDRADPAEARPPLEVLDTLDLDAVLALSHEGTELLDWGALVPDRTGECPECGLPDGPKHHNQCLAHPRPTNVWAAMLVCLLVPLPLTLFAGPWVYGFYVPTMAVALYVRSR